MVVLLGGVEGGSGQYGGEEEGKGFVSLLGNDVRSNGEDIYLPICMIEFVEFGKMSFLHCG